MSWASTVPALLGALTLLVLPGLVVGCAAGLRGVPLLTTAPLLSYGTLALAIMACTRLSLQWGPWPIIGATVVLALLGAALSLGVRLLGWWRGGPDRAELLSGPARWRAAVPRGAGLRTSWRSGSTRALAGESAWIDSALVIALVVGYAVITFVVVTEAIPGADAIAQSWDAPFHLNAIARVHDLASAAPVTVGHTADLHGTGAFYPPLFHAIASMVVPMVSDSVPAAANVTALAVTCVAWPLSVLGLVRAVTPRRAALVAGAAVAAVVGVFPTHLMSFGVLWPNLTGLAALPAAIALLASLLAPVGRPPRVAPTLFAGVVGAVGLYYAHPGTIFAGIAIGLPLLVVGALRLAGFVRRVVERRSGLREAGWGSAAALLVVIALAGWQLWHVLDTMAQIKTLREMDWSAFESYAQATGEALTLSLTTLHPLVVVAVLALAGAAVVWRDRRIWLVAAHVITMYLYTVAAATDESIAETLTGFWYNDRHRIMAALAITAVPLAAIGATYLADVLRESTAPRLPHRMATSARAPWALGAASLAVVLGVGAWATPVAAAWGAIQNDIEIGYEGEAHRVLTTAPEAKLYTELATLPDPQAAVVGNPLNGSVLAGVLSHRPSVFGHLKNVLSPEQKLVGKQFKSFTTDPAVCRAVKDLHIGYAVEDAGEPVATREPEWSPYTDLNGLAGTPGLTPVLTEGLVTVYRVGPCRS